MSMRATGTARDPRIVDEWEGGFGWIAHPEETMRRASHALAADGDVWVIDPVDAEGIDDRLADLGEVAGVVVLLDRHRRDSAAVARRHDVPVYVPAWMDGVARGIDAPLERFEGELADTGYRLRRVVSIPYWREGALVSADGETLVVADALGTADYFLVGEERLGVSPPIRLIPPRDALGDLSPERVLVGHGAGVMEDAAPALADTLRNSRRRTPKVYLNALRSVLSG